ncbi:RagB/SusD family nutrient uptake outer membrane protein [Niabella ginsengisoli]|uniref:RagB/SusD family nutrient uptake outer membrane protein n=1 Tax=Niabella ginsengisoli TaxID=522298 RepID=A0ABS9SPY6_9BACT|nr:RagB/SusD family nutrient uptake outer membrane protein [Niabella ginsengisoli]MCH5600436.1 RagB/SusD family nutrient uptake outer membrane protein [Niabella ginsengisoli]
MNKIKTIRTIVLAAIVAYGTVSCNKYLDVLPDNRAELNTEEKIAKILVSAYPQQAYILSAEISSDNVDDYGVGNPNTERLLDELFYWKDVTEVDTDSPKLLWEACYKAIASANEALNAIQELGNPTSLDAQRGEALVARAYNHFILVNIFAQHYSKQHSAADLGITYMTAPEQTLNPSYKRNTVAEVYENIKKDLETGIPLIQDGVYGNTPKFHFNKAAANAFAARVALYTQDWGKAVSYADAAIGINPTGNMRDNVALAGKGVGEVTPLAAFYASSSEKANLLLQTAYSDAGLIFGNYYTGSRYSHGKIVSEKETFLSNTPWGTRTSSGYIPQVFRYSGTNIDKHLVARVAYLFEFTDPVAQIGYRRAVYAPLTTEEALLTRAEAYIMTNQYDKAVQDMRYWVNNNLVTPPTTFTVASINTWANSLQYYTPQAPTPKKKLNPEFTIADATQENLLHCVLFIRRLETMHTGLRWFDVKRYNIEVPRRVITSAAAVGSVDDANALKIRDNRMAIQLPQDVIAAGLEPNPR